MQITDEQVLHQILYVIAKEDRYNMDRYIDLYQLASYQIDQGDIPLGRKYLHKLSEMCEYAIITGAEDEPEFVEELYDFHKRVCLHAAPYDFDSYLNYVEWDRPDKRRFYSPRKKQLRSIVAAMQMLENDELDLLCISMPPGCGKTTLAIFFLTWLAGKYPDEPNLTGSHSNSFVRGVYDECLRIMDKNGEYLWHDVFPDVPIVGTNAKDSRIDLGKRKRFDTLEFTSIGTGNAGLYRASRLLYCDDLVSGLEVAMSKERLDKLWEMYTTDLRQRKIGDHCKELHIATRWSVHDVIGRLELEYGDDPRAKFIAIPAMNEEDRSNFQYQYGVGFSTQFYKKQREIMDDVSWRALYMNEPIEREGLLFSKEELRRYFELPDEDPDAILAVCDTKDRGADYCCMPIAYKYGEDYYIDEIICDNSNPEVVDARLIDVLVRRKVQMARFESNAAGGRVAKTVQEGVKERGGITKITTKFTTANKETKIIVNSPFAKEHFLFKDESSMDSREYKKAVDFLCSYTMNSKNKHDDVPDAIAQLVEYVQSFEGSRVEVFARPW